MEVLEEGGFRDPANVRPEKPGGAWQGDAGVDHVAPFRKTATAILDEPARSAAPFLALPVVVLTCRLPAVRPSTAGTFALMELA